MSPFWIFALRIVWLDMTNEETKGRCYPLIATTHACQQTYTHDMILCRKNI